MPGQAERRVDMAGLRQDVNNLTKSIDKVLGALYGKPGSNGLITQTALNKQGVARLWWAIGVIIMVLLGVGGLVLKRYV